MKKDTAINYIANSMSLRTPQRKSLTLFVDYLESKVGKKILVRKNTNENLNEIQKETLSYVNNIPELKTFQAFERTFPAFTFALATGVGKTRLMGAFVAYLYLVYGIQHFMIVAPGNTIYRKLQEDFSNANNPKYVFRGIGEINTNTTRIIHKNNYEQNNPTSTLFGNQIQINIFNIQQFAQKDIDKEKGITKTSEIFGTEDGKLLSYFDYLASLNDLVLLMDESHHYHADAAMGSLDRVNPTFGLEFTATPYTGSQIGRGKEKRPEKKRNIFYSYNLGDAIRDGYVKDPWVGTEADVDFSQWESDSIETDGRKLQLAAFFHERAKVALKEYALEKSKSIIKPVMLVVAKDTKHANELRQLIDSDHFRAGTYKGKVIEVHSKTRGDEEDETIEKLISLENPDNIVEIVIHVNMLKEGWDVANIYTIAPIRSSAAQILTEQTIGRGLRLPFGEKTGIKNIDRVMIVAHDNYAKIIKEAQQSALIQPSNIESISAEDMKIIKDVIEVPSAFVESIQNNIKSNVIIMQEIHNQALNTVDNLFSEDTPEDVKKATVQNKTNKIVEIIAKQKAEEQSFAIHHSHERKIETTQFQEGTLFNPFSAPVKAELDKIGRISGGTIEIKNIPIPRLILTPHYGELVINNFDLNTKKLSRFATDTSILEQRLQGNEEQDLFGHITKQQGEIEFTRVTSLGEGRAQSPENTIISGLIDFPLIDYEDTNQTQLLIKLSNQAVTHYKSFVTDTNALKMMVENNYRQISHEIYDQILDHKEYKSESYLESGIREPRAYLEQYNISRTLDDNPVTLESQYDRFSRDKIYNGFKKACHSMYRFDSSDEVRMAYLLDRDNSVKDWLRPAPNQFEGLYWRDETGNSQHRYEPDFVVELENEIVMVEVKPGTEVDTPNVQAKKQTAEKYCDLVSNNIGKYGIIKPWRYVIIPTDKIKVTSTILGLLK